MLAVLAVLAACSGAPAPATPSNRASTLDGLVAIAAIPRLPYDRGPAPDGVERDCRLGNVVRKRFGRERVRSCGELDRGADESSRNHAAACMTDAIRAGTPFFFEMQFMGTDSVPMSAVIGIRERGELVVYRAFYDSDPCGGGCMNKGGTGISRCRSVTLVPTRGCEGDPSFCFTCDDAQQVDGCKFGPC